MIFNLLKYQKHMNASCYVENEVLQLFDGEMSFKHWTWREEEANASGYGVLEDKDCYCVWIMQMIWLLLLIMSLSGFLLWA